MSTDKFKSNEFIARYIAGELSHDERIEFETWIDQHPEEGAFFQEMGSVWTDSQRLEVRPGQSSSDRWAQLSESIAPKQKSISLMARRIYAMTASVILIGVITYLVIRPKMVEIVAPLGGEAVEVFLPDSSKVTLNADSRISYNAKKWDRSRDLVLEGEAFFEVKKSTTPFEVFASRSHVTVLGTSFNIRERGNESEVFCATGKVRVDGYDQTQNEVILEAGQVTLRRGLGDFSEPALVEESWKLTSWTIGEFHFSSTPLREVVKEIERQFKVEINLPDNFDNELFNGQFSRGDLDKVLKIVSLSTDLAYRQEGNRVNFFLK